MHAFLSLVLFPFILYTTVILIASFAPVFNGNICLGKQDDDCMASRSFFPTSGVNRVVWQGSKLEAETFKLGWMAGWEQAEDRDFKLHAWIEKEENRVLQKTC